MYKKYVAINQYNDTFFCDNPRKDLMEHCSVKHAENMYRDDVNGKPLHVGYIVSGLWWEVMKLSPMK